MDTIFGKEPLRTCQFFDGEKEIAYVVLEDEGDYWSILVSTNTGEGIQQTVDHDLLHPNPYELTIEFYNSAVAMVRTLLQHDGTNITEVETNND